VALAMLRKLGLRADAVANGREAVRALEQIPYSVVLMDVQMPEMNGFEATQAIRAEDGRVLNRRVPVIAMTANAMRGDREACIEAGMDDYVAKPVSLEALAEALDRWLTAPVADSAPSEAGEADEQAAPSVAPDVFDETVFLERTRVNRALAVTIAETFLDDVPTRLTHLFERLDAGDLPGVQEEAHAIKGAAGTVAGEAMRRAAERMEHAARDGDAAAVTQLKPELAEAFEALGTALRTFSAPPS